MELLEEPSWLTLDRGLALLHLKNAHILLATAAACVSWPSSPAGLGLIRLEMPTKLLKQRDKLQGSALGPSVKNRGQGRLGALPQLAGYSSNPASGLLASDRSPSQRRAHRGVEGAQGRTLQHVGVEHVDQWIRRPATLLARFGVMGLDQLKQCLSGHIPYISEINLWISVCFLAVVSW